MTRAYGNASHAEGSQSVASGFYSHAEGNTTQATNNSAHSEGAFTKAYGTYAHAEGYSSTASGTASHAAGKNASATNANTWVWSDGTVFGSTTTNQFSAYAANGFRLLGGAMAVNGGVELQTNLPPGLSVQGATLSTDGTNLIVVLRDSAGTLTTNKVTLTTWP